MTPGPIRLATEGALWGSVQAHGLLPHTVIVSDDAGQFNVGVHNGSENDIRCLVTRRKISAETRSDIGRDCRDGFLGLMKTCRKLGIPFWNYLGSRFGGEDAEPVPDLAGVLRARCAA